MMTEKAPERIWAWVDQGRYAKSIGLLEGEWSDASYETDEIPKGEEYVRADIHQALEADAEALAEQLENIAKYSDWFPQAAYDVLAAFRAALEGESEMSPVKDREDYEV